MKKQFTIYLLLTALTLVMSGCSEEGINGKGPVVEEERMIDEFTSLYLQIPAKLYVYSGSESSVRIRSNQNLMSRIETTVINGELRIETIPDVWIRNTDVLNVYVTSDLVSNFSINGSGLIMIEDCLDTNSASFEINGSGDIHACGETDVLSVVVNGSGKFRGFDLQSKTAEVEIHGSGDIEMRVSETLEATISGSGNVQYVGSPQVFTHISGSGNVKKK